MKQENQIMEALDVISAWNIPDEQLTQAVKDWANLIAMVSPDDLWEDTPENH